MLGSQGKYKEAEAIHQRALKGREKVLELEHPHTLTSFSNLGPVLESRDKHKEAEALQQRALKGGEKVLGLKHPYTLTGVSNLGLVLESQGKYKEAEAIHQRAVAKLLLACNDVEAGSKDNDGRTPLWYIAWNGQEAVVKLLLAREGWLEG